MRWVAGKYISFYFLKRLPSLVAKMKARIYDNENFPVLHLYRPQAVLKHSIRHSISTLTVLRFNLSFS